VSGSAVAHDLNQEHRAVELGARKPSASPPCASESRLRALFEIGEVEARFRAEVEIDALRARHFPIAARLDALLDLAEVFEIRVDGGVALDEIAFGLHPRAHAAHERRRVRTHAGGEIVDESFAARQILGAPHVHHDTEIRQAGHASIERLERPYARSVAGQQLCDLALEVGVQAHHAHQRRKHDDRHGDPDGAAARDRPAHEPTRSLLGASRHGTLRAGMPRQPTRTSAANAPNTTSA
jgi:hypothetical protein